MSPIDPITLEVITEGLISVVREMRATIYRAARSVAIYEGKDFSCGLFDPMSQVVAQSEDIGAHVVPLPWSVKSAMKEFGEGLTPGDIILLNDPYRSGTHLNDVTTICPVFEGNQLIFFPAVVEHWADVGGMTPGSLSGLVTEIYQEGIRIPPIKIVDKGKLNKAVMDLLLLNMRVPEERRGDFYAGLAAFKTAERRIHEMVARYGVSTLLACIQQNMDRSEERMREKISAIPDGEYHYEDYLEVFVDGVLNPVIMNLTLTIRGSELIADFTGSSPQVAAPVNSTLAVTAAAVFIVVKSVFDTHAPLNQGAFRPITVTAPEGTIVNAVPYAPVGAQGEIRKRAIGVMVGALAQVVPDLVAGDLFRTTFHNLFGGTHPRTGKQFVHYEWASGGNGAFSEDDGPSAMSSIDWGLQTTVPSAEVLESQFPLLVQSSGLAANSGGDGRQRGGLGIRREVRLVGSNASYSVLADAAVVPPFGILGGFSGIPVEAHVVRNNQILQFATPGKVSGFQLVKDDVVVLQSPGGGGYGDPLDRTLERVLEDVREGYITRDRARERYGVAMLDDLNVDLNVTESLRRQLASTRTRFIVVDAQRDLYAFGVVGKRRLTPLNPGDINAAGLNEGDLVELVGRNVPLRAWLVSDPTVLAGTVPLDARGRNMLAIDVGQTLYLRRVSAGHLRSEEDEAAREGRGIQRKRAQQI
jgi:N-methylhydantoinase B